VSKALAYRPESRTLASILMMLLLAGCLVAFLPSSAEAVNQVVDITYFSDANFTVIVGGSHRDCDGSFSSWGTVTPYRQTHITPCP
jgi:hypothetical protein